MHENTAAQQQMRQKNIAGIATENGPSRFTVPSKHQQDESEKHGPAVAAAIDDHGLVPHAAEIPGDRFRYVPIAIVDIARCVLRRDILDR